MYGLEHNSPHRPPEHAQPLRSDRSVAADGHTDAQERPLGSFSADLVVEDRGDPQAAVISVCGEVDLATAPALRETLLPAIEQRTGRVVVDLSEVSFMDSTGVHVLVEAHHRLTPQSRRLAIMCREHGQVHRLLLLTGLLDLLADHDMPDRS